MISGEVIRFGFPLQILLIELIRLHVVNLVGKMLFQLKLEHVAWQFISHKVRENTAWRITQIVEQEVPFDKRIASSNVTTESSSQHQNP